MKDDAPSRTAEVVCLARARDQSRSPDERILDDPYARSFLSAFSRAALATADATGKVGEAIEGWALGLLPYVLCRHRYIDDRLAAFLADPAPGRVVLLGAGYDSRAWRFADALNGRTIYEVDHPATAGRKERIVARMTLPEVDRRLIVTDFIHTPLAQALADGGVVPGERTFFVWEGVSMYLTREAIKQTFRVLREVAGPGSQLAMDFWFLVDQPDLIATAHRMSPGFLSLMGEHITFGIHPEDVGDFLRREGLRLVEVADAEALERRYVKDSRRVYPAAYLLHAEVG